MSADKIQLRAIMKSRREQIMDKKQKDKQIARLFFDLAAKRKYDSLFTYLSMGSEVDTFEIVKELMICGEKIGIPYTHDGVMSVKVLENLPKTLALDKLGNLEGIASLSDNQIQCECALVPLLAFNSRLYRLGYGGGYYDKYLKDFRGEKIGLAYAEQLNDEFFQEPFDVPLDAVITENGIIERS